jgi:2-polyprenyl-3-methyl-5-hydroxy-6-metoxy-1,4-benzoquinol methylase
MFEELEKINEKPVVFGSYTAAELWADDHTSKQMLYFHLNESIDVSSRRTDFIDKSVEWIVPYFKVGSNTRIADFGCGPGLYATRLSRKLANVIGIDFSASSIEYARGTAERENLSAKYINENYLEFETDDHFNLILMIMCDFCALSPAQRKHMLSKFHAYLMPGGSVLLDVYSLNAFDQRVETAVCEENLLNGFWSPNKYFGFMNTFKYEKEKVVLDKYTIVESDRNRVVYNWLQYFSPDMIKQEFEEAGFKIATLFSDVKGTMFKDESMEFAVVATKG